MEILANPPDNRRRDLDNLLKGTLDSLQHANIYPDDNQIDKLKIERTNQRTGTLDITISIYQSAE